MFNRPAIAASLLLLVPIACAGPASDEPIASLEASANRARQREGAAPVVIPTRSVDGKVELSAGGKEIEMELNGELPAGSGF